MTRQTSFIRPEARAQIARWQEVIAGGALMLLGGWFMIGPGGLLMLPGVALLPAGAALAWAGLQRVRMRQFGNGPGAVDVDEGEVTYFGPLTGGSVALRALTRIALDPEGVPAHWRLEQRDGTPLMIPVTAAGAEDLLDAFAALPGFRSERMVEALNGTHAEPVVIWQRGPVLASRPPAH